MERNEGGNGGDERKGDVDGGAYISVMIDVTSRKSRIQYVAWPF